MPRKRKYKALLIDFDGTLVGKDFKVTPRVRTALERAGKKVHIGIASGRNFNGVLKQVATDLRLLGPHIICGGGGIYDAAHATVLWQTPIPVADTEHIYRLIQNHIPKAIVDVEQPEKSYTNSEYANTRGQLGGTVGAIEDFPTDNVLKITIIVTSRDQANSFAELARGQTTDLKILDWTIPSFDLHGVDITAASKLEGVVRYLELMNLKREVLIVVGDGENDFPLLMAGGLKVAMGHATQVLRDIADYVAPTVENDGLADVIETFILRP